MKTNRLTIRNIGSNRVTLGPPPRSRGGDRKLIKFDTAADAEVSADKRLGQVHTVEGERAEQIRKSKVVSAMAAKLGLQIG